MTLDACAEIVRRGDPDRFRVAMAAPVVARARLLPLFAFNVEVARAPWVTAEPMIAEMRLQWWRDVLEEIAQGGPVRRHEVATPLSQVLAPGDAQALDALVLARRWDAYREPFADEAAFLTHIEATGGTLLEVAGAVMGAPRGAGPLRDLGVAMGLANWLVAVPELETRGRIPLVDGRPQAVVQLARTGLDRLARARAARGDIPAAAVPAARMAWRAGPVLRRAEKSPGRVAAGALDASETARRASLIWRAMLGGW
ncbi:squalene/phytoene synthase family protein [Rhodovulum adriaticum]|uniref:Phytoene/squalene synthetase n=1 Tax=Rhodovulum adriaticum TaxID=35804 RepID=A0A4R2NWW9_RHOAD|nr:squalene/phytoene synthase family protein [Rhodovulum adriaticum]MBK1635658.1 phytoene synthase [Rhodovulum adriaticum]TCP26104.1 phytoene/squalene synthetase [Rhodovulum adriaticum]